MRWIAAFCLCFVTVCLWTAPAAATDDHPLISEAVATPTAAEFIEIFNPTPGPIPLDGVFLSDDEDYALLPAAFGGATAPPNITSSDFIVGFPPGAIIDSCQALVVAFDGLGFINAYGNPPDFEIFDTDPGIPNMQDIGFTGSSAGLTNSGESAVLFLWDGFSDLVADLDMVNIGTPSGTNDIGNKTGVQVDGPDPDPNPSPYQPDAGTMPLQSGDPGAGVSTKRIALEAGNEATGGGNGITGDDETSENIANTWDDAATFGPPNPGFSNLCPTGGPPNDDCPGAQGIGDGDTPFTTVGATDDGPQPCAPGGADVWFIYTAAIPGTLIVSTCNQASFDTILAIYPAIGCPPDITSTLDCNDDEPGCAGNTSVASTPVVPGESYLIQVSGFLGAQGDGVLNVQCVPAQPPPNNDNCPDARPAVDGITNFDTTFATTDGDQPCSTQDTLDIWYVYTATADGNLDANTCQSLGDTVLTVWNTSNCADTVSGNELDCSDDFCGPGPGFASQVNVPVAAGNDYLIQVSGWGGNGSPGTLEIICTPTGPPPIIIPAGPDGFSTPCGLTKFCCLLAPGALEPGSLGQTVTPRLGGLDPSQVDTIVERLDDMVLDSVGAQATVPIQLVELSLISCEPINVEVDDGSGVELVPYDVLGIELLTTSDLGSMTVLREHENGGVFNAEFFVRPLLTFQRSDQTLPPVQVECPEVLLSTPGAPWVSQLTIPDGSVFNPGVVEDTTTLEQCCILVGHAGPQHFHETGPPDCSGCPGCCMDISTNPPILTEDVLPQDCVGPDLIFLGPQSTCLDSDNDGLPDVVETDDCCWGFLSFADTGTDPFNADTDGDGRDDLTEIRQGTDPCIPEVQFIRGDCDGNGVYNPLADALYCLGFAFLGGPAPPCAEASDADRDRMFNGLADSLYILTHGFLGGPPPSAPFPDCGQDPEPANSLGCNMSGCP